jgi:hypothetical protein
MKRTAATHTGFRGASRTKLAMNTAKYPNAGGAKTKTGKIPTLTYPASVATIVHRRTSSETVAATRSIGAIQSRSRSSKNKGPSGKGFGRCHGVRASHSP